MGTGEQAQLEPLHLPPVRTGSTQLRRYEVRHGGTENRPLFHRQEAEVLPRGRDART